MRTKMPLKKGGRVFKKGMNTKKKMLKSRNEVAVKFITDIIARHGLDFSAKLTQILRIHQANKPHTYDQFGLVNFVEKSEGKLIGDITNKRPDLRVIEVGLDGKEAVISKLEVPVHPLQTAAVETLDIVKKGLITAEKVTEVSDYLKSEKFGKESFEIDLEEKVSEEDRLLVRNVLQVRCGIDALVSLAGTKITVKKFDGKKDKRNDVWLWEKPFVRFVLHRNLRYANILERAAKHIGVPISRFQKCRMENTAGYTLQVLQLEKVEPALIQQAFERTMSIVSDFEFTDEAIEQDKYQGYRTKAVIRKLKMTEEEVKKALNLFCEKGYINYFGVSPNDLLRTPRHDIGKHIVKNDFCTAGKAIIRPRPLDRDIYEELKEFIFVANDPRIVVPAFKFLKLKESNDLTAKIVTAMVDNRHGKLEGKFATQAFAKADPKQVMEYTDAFLNIIWNQTVNKLIEKRGGSLTLAVGDLVFVDEAAERFILYECSSNSSVMRDSIKEGQKSYKEYVKALTEEDIKSGKYTPFDLVIPVLGFDVKYPENEISTIIDELLNKNDISSKDWFQKAHSNTIHGVQVTFRGTYRRVLQKPKNMSYKIEKYTDDKLPLFLQDIPVRKRDEPEKVEEKTDEGEKTETEESKENETKNGEEVKPVEEKKPAEVQDALILDFFVPKGTQTVIALRELFKKNDFGDLAAPFSERISDKNFSSRCKDKMKFLLNHCKHLHMRGPPMPPGPMMRGPPPMGPPMGFMGPMGRPMGPDPNARIHMLEQELLNLKRKTQKMDVNRPQQRGGNNNNRGMGIGMGGGGNNNAGGGHNNNNRGNPRNVNASPQKQAQQQNKQQLNKGGPQMLQQQQQHHHPQNNAGGNINRQRNNNASQNNNTNNRNRVQQQGGNTNARNLNNTNRNNNNFGNNNNNNNRQQQQQDNNNSSWNNSVNQNNFGNNQFRGQNQGQARGGQQQGQKRNSGNFNNANNNNSNSNNRGGGFNQQQSLFQQNFDTGFNDDNDFTNDFIPPPMKRNRFENNSGQSNSGNNSNNNRNGGGFRNQSNFQNNRQGNSNNSFGNNQNGNQNRFGGNNNSGGNIQGLFERRNDYNDFSSDINGGGNNFSNQNRGGGNLLQKPAFMAGANRNNFGGGNRRGNFNF